MPKGSPHPENAKKFLDFCASAAVWKIAADFSGIAAADAYSTPAGRKIAAQFLPLDFARAGAEKKAIVKTWQDWVTR